MQKIKKILPIKLIKALRPLYHGAVALLGHWYYGRPSRKMIVIGVTGTNGKSTTVNLIAKILEEAGFKVGYTSTVTLKVAGQEILNNMKMTMPSGWLLQKWMRQMVNAGCQYAVLEVSSEGLAQNRHLGVNFDVAVFTNLTPEHLDSHGGFENYRLAKAKLFEVISKNQESRTKKNINPDIQKTIITNSDDRYGKFYASFKAGQYISFGVNNQSADLVATDIQYSPNGVCYNLKSKIFNLKLKGQFDVYNSLAAIATAQSLGVGLDVCQKALAKVGVVPGRVEVLQTQPFTVVVDYAYEPEEMRQLYETVSRWPHQNFIQVLGPTGGGRDKARIEVLGEMAAKFAAAVFITTDDPYDDDPKALGQGMAEGAKKAGKVLNQDLFCEYDRRQAIRMAMQKSCPGDLVLITGKGADQKMALAAGVYLDWDDRKIVREELGKLQLREALSTKP